MSPYVVVVGPDGSGKSAVAEGLVRGLEVRAQKVTHLHVDPWKPVQADSLAVSAPHAGQARPAAIAALSLAHRWFRYVESGWVGPISKSQTRCVVQERGWLDQQVDTTRYRLPPWFAGVVGYLGRATRHPDLVILCHGDPKSISDRKQELTSAETSRQIEEWRTLIRGEVAVEVETVTNTIGTSIQQATAAVMDTLATHPAPAGCRSVPLAPRRLDAVCTSTNVDGLRLLLRPASRRGRVARRASLLASSLRIGEPRRHLPVPLVELTQALGMHFDGLALIRSHGRRRWVAALSVEETIIAFVKIAPASGGKLDREGQALQDFGGRIEGVETPEVIGLASLDEWQALYLKPVRVDSRPPRVDLDVAVDIAISLARVLGSSGIVHGDLAPWNILNGPSGTVLVDWERCSTEFLPGRDLEHYLRSSGLWAQADSERSRLAIQASLERYCSAIGANPWALFPIQFPSKSGSDPLHAHERGPT